MLHGYAGRILHVDLTTGKTHVEPLNEEYAKKYIGGIGLGMRLWLDHSKPGVEPLSPENPLILATGPISGTVWPTGGNGHAFVSKSPQSYGVGEAKSHGSFGTELKRAGYDAVIFKGKAEKPVYVWIDDDSVQLLDASHLMGKSPADTEDAIREELGDYYIRVAAIGPAGEKLVKIACIINDKTRAAGRTGMGAVMGSKNLKAIAVRGTRDITVAKPEEFLEYVKEFHERMKGPATQKYRTLGTPENVLVHNALHCMPTRNYNNATFEGAERVSGEVLNERYVAKVIGCSSCAMRCEHICVVAEGPYKGTMTRMEYEPLWALGPYCGIDRLDAIIKGMDLCNYFGMDSISAGVIVGFAMDCYEKGILTEKDTDGIDAKFGNHEALVKLLEKMGKREGIGDILAEGVKGAAEKIGNGAEKLALHIKGVEVTGYDLRCLKTAALGFAVSFRGADHNRHGAYAFDVKGKVNRLKAEKGRGKLVKDMEDMYTLIDSFIVCKFSRGTYYKELEDMTKLYNLVTGAEMTTQEMKMAGERINNLARVFNVREGLGRKDDNLPWKVMNQPITDEGPSKGAYVTQEELDLLLDDYYEARGWTREGVPTVAKLKELGMDDLIHIVEEKM
ncbi:MAG: aldehyde ferredoxin oxidoreductase family protein [Candidatus Bathyarchaeota archaeon]|jgi:aldehyde:ferredoxin oxidoreductase|nr:aldehyde ferredoxin oxidoreductase family protein [Candidatus Bathyarchaeota archaeon A05DMB-5]MDH7558172.1 aldehyde ferredoxin oxidoreductase family protein [Candidatus Bathyarchaeota archaeon]